MIHLMEKTTAVTKVPLSWIKTIKNNIERKRKRKRKKNWRFGKCGSQSCNRPSVFSQNISGILTALPSQKTKLYLEFISYLCSNPFYFFWLRLLLCWYLNLCTVIFLRQFKITCVVHMKWMVTSWNAIQTWNGWTTWAQAYL